MNSGKSDKSRNAPERRDPRGRAPLWAEEWRATRDRGAEEAAETSGRPSTVENFEGLVSVGRSGRRAGWETSPYLAMPAGAAAAQEAKLRAGEVWLLNPRLPVEAERPVFVLVMSFQDASRRWLVTPFSPLSEVVAADELATGIDEPGLRVLSLWNAAPLAAGVVACGRRVDTVEGRLLEEAMQSLGRLTDRMPIHPLDPRWEYIEEEGGLLAPLRCFEPVPVFCAKGQAGSAPSGLDWVAAAASGCEIAARYRIGGGNAEMRLDAGAGRRCNVSVCDASGGASEAWDGARLLTFAEVSDPVQGGRTAVALPSLGEGFALVDAAGELVPLEADAPGAA